MKLISIFVFAIRIVQYLFYLNPKFQASSHLLWLSSSVCVGPGQKPRRPVFSERGSFLSGGWGSLVNIPTYMLEQSSACVHIPDIIHIIRTYRTLKKYSKKVQIFSLVFVAISSSSGFIFVFPAVLFSIKVCCRSWRKVTSKK